jgi:hypothetical protein
MNTIHKKVYELPQVERILLDSDISLTLDSSMTPVGDPEALMQNPMATDPLAL